MSEHSQNVLITFLVVIGVISIGLIIFFAGMRATQITNDRLERVGSDCVKAGHLWINSNCIPEVGANGGK